MPQSLAAEAYNPKTTEIWTVGGLIVFYLGEG